MPLDISGVSGGGGYDMPVPKEKKIKRVYAFKVITELSGE
jgi:hypothetical protein